MKTKRLVMAGAVAMALAGGAGTALALGGSAQQAQAVAGAPEAAAGSTESLRAAGADAAEAPGPRVVQPYEPVEIGQGARMGLLPQGRQNYVVVWGDDFAESVAQAKGYVGDSIRPNSLSGGLHTDGDDALFTGAFRTDTVPARITVRVGTGPERDAGVLMLPGDPGWGTYYLDAAGAGAPKDTTEVTAYGADGAVLATLSFKPFLAGR
ncbi:hypothetical protein [Streptomyces peucetius]|uniref:Uncharacterized protein n=1 Tax=Streptomyces peucetius TaxID=1950 RepID=A0ABY6I5T3_STRPE|nr:hypothetical protein [Streptomyces peucetius]UYQ62196.1 hypothetical protein OGH68_12355 [Streptomyces peucetius]